ncbi:uncharacterized protein BJ212DRAFT_1305222 [Suillus subaureus]|uniref:Uncharacterized protein n=1 Tax=Suillus subaureus TaxID=48587 RepID=A0A9P7J3H3_9AGAM|nr:uncharacterized protein BJ212DRAFT_1305222 [Suillus subaureus]KAG1800688.1 hypothetical protein BJ212DRAFT_1305222 [Suillus subaureus]
MMIGARAQDGGQQMKGGRKRIGKPAFKLETDGDGMPLLPDITEMKLKEKKAIVRAFLTSHYRVDLKEPSKSQNWDTTALLNFWHAQQEKGKGPTFLFKAWKNKDGDMLMVDPHKRDPEESQVLQQHMKGQQSHVQFQSLAQSSRRKLVHC